MNKNITDPNVIFVFGSNLAGIHGAGAARLAVLRFGAMHGIGHGPTGRAYALPTKDEKIQTLPLEQIERYVRGFLDYARVMKDTTFLVTAIGSGLAGYAPEQIAPFFRAAPENVFVSPRFIGHLVEKPLDSGKSQT